MYNGHDQGPDQAYAEVVSPDGTRVYVTGFSDGGSTSTDIATVAYDAHIGSQLWVARFDGAGGADVGRALAVSPDGAVVIVTGSSWGGPSQQDFVTVAYDASSGTPLWTSRYDGPASGSDFPTAIGVSPDGARVLVAGRSPGVGSSVDYATAAYDTADGAQLWISRYDGPAGRADDANALQISPDGAQVYVTGDSWGGSTNEDIATVAYTSATGSQSWVARYDGPTGGGADLGIAVGVSPDGSRLYVAGDSPGPSTGDDFATIAYDTSGGEERWVSRYDGPESGSDDVHALGLSPDGNIVYVTGASWGGSTGDDEATVAYAATSGIERWVVRQDVGGDEVPTALAVARDGRRIYVTGYSLALDSSFDWVTIGYASSGAATWGRRERGHRYDAPYAVAVSPVGSAVFVAGEHQSNVGNYNYATIAYAG